MLLYASFLVPVVAALLAAAVAPDVRALGRSAVGGQPGGGDRRMGAVVVLVFARGPMWVGDRG